MTRAGSSTCRPPELFANNATAMRSPTARLVYWLSILSASACIALLSNTVDARSFGPQKTQGTLEVYFTPRDRAEKAIIHSLDQARQSIHIQAFSLTSKNISRAIVRAVNRGVKADLLLDKKQALGDRHSRHQYLAKAGVHVRFETRYRSAHNKIMIIDAASSSPTLITGSYNFSYSAQARNAENLLIFRNAPALTAAYLRNWQYHADRVREVDNPL